MREIKSYENSLFDLKYNNSLQFRKKGRLEFKDLTQKEFLNYIKHNIHQPSEIFDIFHSIHKE